ncbi:MAG TPA: hypothetical protein VM580_28075 [Labilithrix sp.]|nr:hypothetical protein [Labilithrix sp.]
MRPPLTLRNLRKDIRATRAARGKRQHVVFGDLRVRKQLPYDVGVWVAQEALGHRAIWSACETLPLSERERPATSVVGNATFTRITTALRGSGASRSKVARRRGVYRVPNEPPEGQQRYPGSLFTQTLNDFGERRILQRVDQREQHLASSGLGLLGSRAQNVEARRQLAHVPSPNHIFYERDAKTGVGNGARGKNDRFRAFG